MNIVIKKIGFAFAADRVLAVYCKKAKGSLFRREMYGVVIEYVDTLDDVKRFEANFKTKTERDDSFCDILETIKNTEADCDTL